MTGIGLGHRRLVLIFLGLGCIVLAAGVGLLGWWPDSQARAIPAGDAEAGKLVYEERCAGCHGLKGDGDGPAAAMLYPRPRDFHRGLYKVHTTPSGALPRDEELFHIISEGMPGTSMPGWAEALTEQHRRDIIAYIKTFSRRFGREQPLIAAAVASLILGWYALALFNLDPAHLNLDPSRARYFLLPVLLLVSQIGAVIASVILTLRDRGRLAQALYVVVTVINAVFILGVYGFVVMTAANPFLRHIAVAQFLMVITCLLIVATIDISLYRGARSVGAIRWGYMPARSQYALLLLCVGIVMVIALMGFIRSGLREDWHVFGVLRDVSPDAFTPTNAYLGRVITFLVPAFLGLMAFVFWLNALGEKHEVAEVRPPEVISPVTEVGPASMAGAGRRAEPQPGTPPEPTS